MGAIKEANARGIARGVSYALDLPQGKRWYELAVARKDMPDQAVPRFIALVRDITHLKDAEAQLARMTKLYAALSQCNQAIVRCADEAELFPQVCRDAVEFGGMRMAWIGLLEETGDRVIPAASFGAGTEYLVGIDISIRADEAAGRGQIGIAMREDRPVWCQDFQHDPMTANWHERGAAFGWAASAALPLHRKGKVVGALSLYADIVGAFDEPAQNLLTEMAMDIGYALDRFDDTAQQQQDDLKIRQQAEKLAALLQISHELAGTIDLQAVLQIATTRMAQISALKTSAIYLCQDAAHLYLGATTPPLPPEFPAQLRTLALADHPHIKRTLDSRQMTVLPDAETETLTPAEAEAVRLRGLRTVLYLPLLAESELLGVLIVASTERAVELQAEEIELCHTLANLAALAVTNAQLFATVRQSKTELQLQAHRAEAMLALPGQAEILPERDFMSHAVELAERLTDSCILFIHLVHEDQVTIELGSWSRATKERYCQAAYDNHYPVDKAGIWADALRQCKPVVFNDYANAPPKRGLPEGHAHLQRLISVPVIEGGLVRMMVCVGNKVDDYTARDVETVQLLANGIWHIVQQRRAAAALVASERELRATFEQAAIGVVQATLDSRFRKVNKKFCELLGYTESELLGKKFLDVTHPDDVQESRKHVQSKTCTSLTGRRN